MTKPRLLQLSLLVFLTVTTSVWAKNCGPGVASCACGDTLVASWTIGVTTTFQCPNVAQALKVADGVYLDCSGSVMQGNNKAQSAAFRLGTGAILVNCWATHWHYAIKVDKSAAHVYASGGWNLADECLHFSANARGNLAEYVYCEAPHEALYLLQAHGNEVRYSYLQGNNGLYAKQGSSGNYIHHCTFAGGPNRVNLTGAGANNYFVHNDYNGGTIKSQGSQCCNYIHPTPNATVNNVDGTLVVY